MSTVRPVVPTARVVAIGHALSLVAGLVVLLVVNRNQWFAGDEWDFLARRGLHGAEAGLFEPHNEHWSTGPILVYRALYSLVGLRSYLPYIAVLVLVHLALAHLLWRIMRRVGVDPWVSTALAAVFAVLGAGTENLVWAFQIGFVGSVLLGMVVILLVDHDGPFDRRDHVAWLVSVVALTFSGISVTMVVIAGLTVLLRRGWAQAAKTVVVPAAVYLLWLMVAGRDSLGAQSNDLAGLLQFGDFVWAGLSNAFERSVGLAGGGPVLLLALAVWLLRRSTLAPTAAAPAFAGALGAVVLFAIIAVGRSGLGAAQPDGPRYVYICIALVLPAVGLALSDLASGGPGRTIAVLGFLGLVLVHNLALLREDAGRDAERERIMKGRVLAGGEVVGSAAATDDGLRALTGLPDLTVGALRRMADEAKLPPPTGVTGEDRLAAATFLQLGVGPGTMDPALPPTARLGEVRRAAVGAAGDGSTSSCVRVTPEAGGVPEVVLTPADDLTAGPISVSLASPGGGELKLSLRTAAGEAVTGPSRTVALAPGQVVRVDDAAPNTSLVLDLPAGGTVDLCGVATGAP